MYSNLNLKLRKRIPGIILNRKNYFAILIFSIIGSLMIILSISKYGPGLTHASVNYYSAAESLVNNYQLRQFDNRIFHEYAPLYTILIGLLILIGFDPIISAGIINVICFSSIIFVGSYYLMQMGIGLKYLTLGGVLLIFSKPIFQVSKYAWDTSLFIFLSIIIFIEIKNYFQNGRKLHLFYCALISSLATLSNFDGITLILFCSILILLNKKIKIKRRVIDLSCYMIISIFPLILYLMRNFHLTGTLIGKKGVPSHGINDILNGFFLTIGNWFIPGIIPQILIIAIAIIIIILLTIIFVYCFKISNINSNIRYPVLFSYFFFIIFSIYIIISRSIIGLGNIQTKILSPIYFPILILFISGIYVFVNNNIISILFLKIKIKDTKKNTLLRTINKRCDFLILILWNFFSFLIVMYLIAFSVNNGAGGYNTTEWRESDLMSSIEEMEFEGKIYSNSPDAIYAILEMKNIELMPRETWYSSTKRANDLSDMKENVIKGHNVTLIWFDNHMKDYLIRLDQIKNIFNITVLISTNDGQILKIENIKAD